MPLPRPVSCLLVLTVLAGACAMRRAPAAPVHGALELHNTTLIQVLDALARRSGRPVVVEPAAATSAESVRVTLLVPPGADDATVARLLDGALESSRLGVTLADGGWVVRRRAGSAAPPWPTSTPTSPSPSPSSTPSWLPAPAPSTDAGLAEDEALARIAAGVRQTTPDTFEVTPAARDLLAEPSRWMRAMRIIPRMRDGEAVGMAVYGIRARSVPGLLGLMNGDVLTALAGHRLTTPEQALEAYSALRGARAVDLDLERRGEARQIHYRLATGRAWEPLPP